MKNNLESKKTGIKIGIWGFGRVGTSVVSHLHPQGYRLMVLDNRTLSPEEKQYLAKKQIPALGQQDLHRFLTENDRIVPSPGIDLRPHEAYKDKWLSELDLFAQVWHKPYIAITGSVGKTTVTHLLGHLLQKSGLRVANGGNIGLAMLNLIPQQDSVDCAVLEVSSFQLEWCRQFAPDLAIWTNFYPNHLDRHSSCQEYFDAKAVILKHQRAGQQALLPLALAEQLSSSPTSKKHFFSLTPPTEQELASLKVPLFFLRDTSVLCASATAGAKTSAHTELVIAQLSPTVLEITFAQNWLVLCAALHLQGISCAALESWVSEVSLPAHRLEKVATSTGIDFYNDSKATTPQSTLAAVQKLSERPILLFLGGLSKGINRSDLIQALAHRVKTIYCFGKEAPQLAEFCKKYGILCEQFTTLDAAFSAATAQAQAGDQLLFSPAGSSFDLFANYEERGAYFKNLVLAYQQETKKTPHKSALFL